MSEVIRPDAEVLVIGAGIMGAGIAQVAAQCGHVVWLHDAREGAAAEARARLGQVFDGLVDKGRLDRGEADAALARIRPAASIGDGRGAGIVIEAIVEQLDAKRALFRELEAMVDERTVLATNTSSISVTTIANGLRHPGRLGGMHFFTPLPQMTLVEVVSGLQSERAVADAVFDLAGRWRKIAVHARSSPGFIVNRIARPYYAEALQLLAERAAEPADLDACLRGAGFRMGPCELMDLIGHDTNFAVTNSVFEANFFDKRYAPSIVQREMVDGGLLGRKSGRGFYAYADGAKPPRRPAFESSSAPFARRVVLHGSGAMADRLASSLTGLSLERELGSGWTGLAIDGAMLRLTDGRRATALGEDVAVFDLPIELQPEPGAPLALALSDRASAGWREVAPTWLRALGFDPVVVDDAPGLVVARTIAMLINEAADAVHLGVCDAEAADAAMKLGVNYPAGPFEWLGRWDVVAVVALIEALDDAYRGERYRVSPWLRRRLR